MAFFPTAWLASPSHADNSGAVCRVYRPGLAELENYGATLGDSDLHSDAGNNRGDSLEREVKRICARCGVPFEGALHGRYHSDACKKAAYRERKKRKQNGNAQTSNELRTCARCGVQFTGALHGRYHSGACKQAAYRERKQRKAVTV